MFLWIIRFFCDSWFSRRWVILRWRRSRSTATTSSDSTCATARNSRTGLASILPGIAVSCRWSFYSWCHVMSSSDYDFWLDMISMIRSIDAIIVTWSIIHDHDHRSQWWSRCLCSGAGRLLLFISLWQLPPCSCPWLPTGAMMILTWCWLLRWE